MPPSSEGAFQRGPEMITAYTAAFPQSGSSSAGIRVIRASDIGPTTSTGEIPLLFSRSAVGFQCLPYWLITIDRII